MFTLVCNDFNFCFKLATGRFKLGRRTNCDMVIPLDSVSKVHLEFLVENEQAKIRDPGSYNGTLLNDWPMEKKKVV